MSLNRFLDMLYRSDIGDADGRICLWLNKEGAESLASCLLAEDKLRVELEEAVKASYPEDEDADS